MPGSYSGTTSDLTSWTACSRAASRWSRMRRAALAVSGGSDSTAPDGAVRRLAAPARRADPSDPPCSPSTTACGPKSAAEAQRGRGPGARARASATPSSSGRRQARDRRAGGRPRGALPADGRVRCAPTASASLLTAHTARRPGRDAADAAGARQRSRRARRHGAADRSSMHRRCRSRQPLHAGAPAARRAEGAAAGHAGSSAASAGSRTRATRRRPSSARACAPPRAELEALGLTADKLAPECPPAAAGASGARALRSTISAIPARGIVARRPAAASSHRSRRLRARCPRRSPLRVLIAGRRRGRRLRRAGAAGRLEAIAGRLLRGDRTAAAAGRWPAPRSWPRPRTSWSSASLAVSPCPCSPGAGRRRRVGWPLLGGSGDALERAVEVRALGADGVRCAAAAAVAVPPAVPPVRCAPLPGFWRGDTLLAVPAARLTGRRRLGRSCRFSARVSARYNSSWPRRTARHRS